VSGAFTLLEMVIVLSIIVVFTGGAITAMVYNSTARKLQRAGDRIEAMAKKARASAIMRQTPYALVFSEGRIDLAPLAEVEGDYDDEGPTGAPERDKGTVDEATEDAAAEGRLLPPVHDSFTAEDGMVLGVRRWGSDDWIVFNNERNRMVWRFDPDGLCEPISVRLEIDDGESWLEQDYHPLTASVRDYSMEAK
jgi:prepilin-type N-terminal cleavage/methylation domain-containing protein